MRMQGVKQSICPSVVVVGTKITRSHIVGICACSKHNNSVDISEKLACTPFELLKLAHVDSTAHAQAQCWNPTYSGCRACRVCALQSSSLFR